MPARTFHIVNLGCKVNRVESDSFAAGLIAQGAEPSALESADLVVVNTCTVTGEAEKKARKAVRHVAGANPVADIVVTGCAAAIAPEVFMRMDPRVRVLPKAEVENWLCGDAGHIGDAGHAEAPMRLGGGFRTRVGLKVQDGCDHACTYCIVHVARGPARSVDAARVVHEARGYFRAGVKEVVLTGIDIGAYESGDVRLPELADQLVRAADEEAAPDGLPARIRVSSVEPLNAGAGLADALARHDGRLCRHLHLPLQSGSTRVLREMDRPYSAERFVGIVEQLRSTVPGIALSTDVIVGFPGETDDDFAQTCEVVRACGFMRLHVFPYSRRQGTPAAVRDDQVDPCVKRSRAAELRAIGAELAAADRESRRGTTELCVVEGETALSESYHVVPAPEGSAPGALVPLVM